MGEERGKKEKRKRRKRRRMEKEGRGTRQQEEVLQPAHPPPRNATAWQPGSSSCPGAEWLGQCRGPSVPWERVLRLGTPRPRASVCVASGMQCLASGMQCHCLAARGQQWARCHVAGLHRGAPRGLRGLLHLGAPLSVP